VSAEPELAQATPGAARSFGAKTTLGRRRRAAQSIHRYSRFVTWMRRMLPAVAIGLLLLVAAWPRLQTAMDRLKAQLPRLDVSQAGDLRMVNLRYTGYDKHGQPVTITSESARQRPGGKDDVVELQAPKADLTTQNGTWIAVTAETGMYQPTEQQLDLFGNVELFQDKGNSFRTDSAHVDIAKGTAEGNDAIEGNGPFGDMRAEGFRIEERGDVIRFLGRSSVDVNPREAKEKP
jgi:lipopolysaccharide export system protein LptC